VLIDPDAHDKGLCLAQRPQDLRLTDALTVGGPWTVTPDGGDRSPLRVRDLPAYPKPEDIPAQLRWDDLAPWEERGLLEFSGGATHEACFEWIGEPPEAAWLDLGEVGIVAEATLNGTSLGVRLWRPYRFDVSDALVRGTNHLKVRVANTLANAIQATYGTGRAETAANEGHINGYARFADGKLRSGLIGPVKMMVEEG